MSIIEDEEVEDETDEKCTVKNFATAITYLKKHQLIEKLGATLSSGELLGT